MNIIYIMFWKVMSTFRFVQQEFVPKAATARAFRAQGRRLISVDESGNVAIDRPPGRNRRGVAVHIGFDESRAMAWIHDMGRSDLITFEVDRSFLERVRRIAQPEHGVARDRTRPWRVDVDHPDQYAFPPAMLDELERAIVPGSGRIIRGAAP